MGALRRLGLFDGLGIVAVGVMIYTLTLLVMRHTTGHGELTLELTQEDLAAGFREGYEYHGIYMGSRKVGAMRTDRIKLDDGYRMKTELELAFAATQSFSRLDAMLDDDFRLRSFVVETRGGQLEGTVKGSWTGSAMVVDADLTSVLTGPLKLERSYALPEAPFFPASLWPVVMRKTLSEGDRMSIPYYDPQSMQPITADIVYRGKTTIEIMGRTVEAFQFEEIKMGQAHDIYVSAIGEVLLEEMPLGMLAVREPEAEARYGLKANQGEARERSASVDLDGLTAKDIERARPEAWRASVDMVVELPSLLTQHFGDAVSPTAGDAVRVRGESPASLPESSPLPPRVKAVFQSELSGSLGVDVDDPELAEVLARYAEHREAHHLLVPRLVEHVAREVKFAAGAAQPTGNAALTAGRGDVLARARAVVALSRAAGVPARLVHGALVVEREGKTQLVRHVWVEVHLGDAWVAVDPSTGPQGQAPADAARLALVRGELENPALLDEQLASMVWKGMEGAQ